MRMRLTSGPFPALAVAATMLCAFSAPADAWDQDQIQSQIQPYFGVWAGGYMMNTQDLNGLLDYGGARNQDLFSSVLPALGGSLGVAYGRLHVGLNGGYQLIDGGRPNFTDSATTSTYYYRYQVVPLDVNVDVALLPNETPVNLLVGGSVGLGLVGMQLPFYQLFRGVDSLHTEVTFYHNDWNWNNFLLATGYVGARINLARRLNLEGQIGWRILRSSEIEIGHGEQVVENRSVTFVDSSGKVINTKSGNIPVDLSGAYVRADIRWTFASDAEREEQRAADRAVRLHEILAMMPRTLATQD